MNAEDHKLTNDLIRGIARTSQATTGFRNGRANAQTAVRTEKKKRDDRMRMGSPRALNGDLRFGIFERWQGTNFIRKVT
jgi:hypothetical protein